LRILSDMTSDLAVRAEGVGKKYVVGHETERERYVALRDVMARTARSAWRATLDLIHGRAIIAGDTLEDFWALKDLNFEIRRGEVVGIIGRNGAGKSTLLKILSRITDPTEGQVTIVGRVASLLEVGTGFHPELTGRENIYLNGTILGMTRSEIKRKFDEIVAFSEVERFLDTPVKRYSSGMYFRLAFAVAAHLEPEILVVDEVLAVGDAEFQKKCLGKMDEVAGDGRTVLFVSHNLGALLSICQKGILLESGRLRCSGEIGWVAEQYRLTSHDQKTGIDQKSFAGPLQGVCFEIVRVNGRNATPYVIASSRDILTIAAIGTASRNIPNFAFVFALYCGETRLFTMHDNARTLTEGRFEVSITIPAQFLRPGTYSVALGGKQNSNGDWTWATDVAALEILPSWSQDYREEDIGLVNLHTEFKRTRRLREDHLNAEVPTS
jgi:ABC-type polysaccharide/polyol phosphate transport system ATPase subunit